MLKHFQNLFFILILAAIFIPADSPVHAQATPDEHSEHHPPESSPMPLPSVSPSADTNSNANTSGGGMTNGASGGMGDMMGEMMKQMGKPPRKELYPSLMEMPDLPPEKRDEIKKLADERVNEGNALLSSGFEELGSATQSQNFAAMQEANEKIRRGQTLLESGLTAQRALAENKNSQVAALEWFKRDMNLAPAAAVEQPHGFFGLSWFHYVSMLTVAAFSAAMIWIYFHKMKRANALVEKLAGNSTETIPSPGGAKPDASPTPKTEPAAVNPDIAPSKPNSWSGTLLVAEIFIETPNVKTFRLTEPAGGKLPFSYLPGQFVTVTVVPNGVPVKRSYTIASSPTNRDYCEITVKQEEHGIVSRYLDMQVHEGELLQFTGPSGKFTFIESEADSIVLIAGGVGVTPMMSVIRYLTDRSWKNDIFFFYSCKNKSSVIFREEIEYLEKRYPNLHVCIILDEPGANPKKSYLSGRITKEILTERVPEIAMRRVHICGPTPMIDQVKQMLDELKVPKENVRIEIFPNKPPAPKKAAPSAAEEADNLDTPDAAPEKAGSAAAVATFAKSNKTAVLTLDKSILEASEDVGVNIDYSCRVGTCGICKTKLISGKVTMTVEEALTEEDKAQNIILACQAKATEDVAVDA